MRSRQPNFIQLQSSLVMCIPKHVFFVQKESSYYVFVLFCILLNFLSESRKSQQLCANCSLNHVVHDQSHASNSAVLCNGAAYPVTLVPASF